MFLDKIEKRSNDGTSFDWTSWVKGEEVESNALKNDTYLRSINILADTVAKLPILVKKTTKNGDIEDTNNDLYQLLRLRANANCSIFTAIKSLILQYKHYGMAGLYIKRDAKGKVEGLYPCRISNIVVDNMGLIKSTKQNKVVIDFVCGDIQESCFEDDIIILKDNCFNGIEGKATRNYSKDSITTNLQAQKYLEELFSNGLTNKAVIQLTSDIKDPKELAKVQDKFKRLYSSQGRIFTLPAGFNISPLNLSLVDSQFAELKLQGKKEITSIIGVPFNLVEKGSLTEEENISFLTTTISPILTQLEQEFNYKLLTNLQLKQGYKIRFNVNAMLRTNAKVQQEILCEYIKNGVYTTNDVRSILGLTSIDGADILLYPSGQATLEDIKSGRVSWVSKGGENGDKTKGN